MLFALAGFAAGLILIVKGGDWFVDAAGWMARVSGIPSFIVGATVVSFATTLPELLVSIIATREGRLTIAVGNAIGSVIANTGLILAAGIIFMPVIIGRRQLLLKSCVLTLSTAVLWLMCVDGSLAAASAPAMLALFAVFMAENIISSKKAGARTPLERTTKRSVRENISKFALGALGIVIGANLLVDNGSALARLAGLSESVIGFTAIAIGTSLPELVTTITAVTKKQSSLSVGNILGANIIDICLILPVCSIISGGHLPIEPAASYLHLPVCLFIILLLVIPPMFTRRFSRWQGFAALFAYALYLGALFA